MLIIVVTKFTARTDGAAGHPVPGAGEHLQQRNHQYTQGDQKKCFLENTMPGIVLSYWPASLHSLAELIPWNRLLGSLKVKNFGLCFSLGTNKFFKKTFWKLSFYSGRGADGHWSVDVGVHSVCVCGAGRVCRATLPQIQGRLTRPHPSNPHSQLQGKNFHLA